MPADPLYFEDVEVGKVYPKSATFEVTREEVIEFASKWDPRPFHVDDAAAAASVFGSLAACSAHIFSILSWFASRGEGRTASLSALGFDEMRMRHPVRPGDRISCHIQCLEKRESRTKPDRGIVRYQGTLINQQGTVVFSAVVTTLVSKRPR
ncbi:MAG: MaoC/PaaZ C-terminal domain-containing protein [Syntrophobacteraceae bacterium]